MNRWTEYCKELYNHHLKGNNYTVVEITNNHKELSLPILKRYIWVAVNTLEKISPK